jgi:hypothetical protein
MYQSGDKLHVIMFFWIIVSRNPREGLELVIPFPCFIHINFVEEYKVNIRDCEWTYPYPCL